MWLGSIWFQELSLRTDMMVDSLWHAQWRGSQCLLPCMGGLQTDLITSGFAWNWFPCKDAELLCAFLMAFFSSLSLSFLFLLSACHENTSTDVNHISGKCCFCWAERLLFMMWWWAGNLIPLPESVQIKSSYWTSQGRDCKVFAKRRAS